MSDKRNAGDVSGKINDVMTGQDDEYGINTVGGGSQDVAYNMNDAKQENMPGSSGSGLPDSGGHVVADDEKQAPGEDTQGFKSYGDIVSEIRKHSEVTPDEEKKELKRHRAMLMLGALSDGIAGMANIFAARKGALPVRHDPVTRQLDSRYHALLKERRRRSGWWDDIEARARMSDLNGKLADEQERRRLGKLSEVENQRDKSEKDTQQNENPVAVEEVRKTVPEQVADSGVNTNNRKKQTGVNW